MICRSQSTAFLVLLSVVLGCSGHDSLEEQSSSAESRVIHSPASPRMCPHTNVLVRPRDGTCPQEIRGGAGTWEGGSILEPRDTATEPAPRICSYYWNAPPAVAPNTSVVLERVGKWSWDCPRVAAHGDELNAALSARGKASLGDLEWTTNVEFPVRVAVIDTAARTWSDPDNNPHGKAVGTLLRDTACGDSPTCKVKVENFLGLPLIRDTETLPGQTVIRRDVDHGGAFGAHGDLARAIVRAVDAGPTTRMVINLSVGYDTTALLATSLIPDFEDLENTVVLDALRYARCHGALIFAAAGNGPVPAKSGQRAAFPARWTELNALDVATCTQLYGVANFADSTQPLLYAVSAVDFGEEPVLTTRESGQSVLAALGFAAVREDPNGGYTRILTGTSMATATVSGIAAAYMSHLTDAVSPDSIVRDLYSVSGSISAVPKLFPYHSVAASFFTDTRLINRCSVAAKLPNRTTTCTADEAASALEDGVVPDLPDGVPEVSPSGPTDPAVGVESYLYPWLFPQPEGDPVCTSCSLKLTGRRLDLTLRSSFNRTFNLLVKKPSSAALAGFAQGALEDTLVIPIASFGAPETSFSVTLSEEDLATVTAAELTYQVEVDGVTVDANEPVLIEDDAEVVEEF
jgi:hypothetical protein